MNYNKTIVIDGVRYYKDRPMLKENARLNGYRKLLESQPKVDRNKEPPKCRLCPY